MATKAIVVGAGVGGLASAIALRQGGVEVSVYERHADPAVIESGGGFILWNNGLKALQQLEVADAVVAAGAELTRVDWRFPNGKRFALWPVKEITDKVGAPVMGVKRQALQSILVDAAGADALHLGVTVERFDDDGTGVTVTFADGGEDSADFLVGADGLRSKVRAQVHGGLGPPAYRGYFQNFGITDHPNELTDSGEFREYDGPGLRFFIFPVTATETYWAAATPAPQESGRVAAVTEEVKADLLRRFGDWEPPCAELISHTPVEAIFRREITDRTPAKTWGAGRVTLVGDAAHPLTPNLGQGACQSIEDAVVLGKAVAGADDLIAALRGYEEARLKRTSSYVRQSRMIAKLGLISNPAAVFVRDLVARLVIPGPAYWRHRRNMAYEF